MISVAEFIKLPFVNIFNDTREDCYFADLSDMSLFYAEMAQRINKRQLSFSKSTISNDYYMLCLINEFSRNVESFNFFSINEENEVEAIVTYVLNRVGEDNYAYVYSTGIYVKEHLRKKGMGKDITKKSISELQSFLRRYGANISIGAFQAARYLLETIVAKSNFASNKLASKFLSSSPIREGDEYYSNEPSYIYSYDLSV